MINNTGSENKKNLKPFRYYLKYSLSFYKADGGLAIKVFFVFLILVKLPYYLYFVKFLQSLPAAEILTVEDIMLVMDNRFVASMTMNLFMAILWTFVIMGLSSTVFLAKLRSLEYDTAHVMLVVRVSFIRLVLCSAICSIIYMLGMELFIIPSIFVMYHTIFIFGDMNDREGGIFSHMKNALALTAGIKLRLAVYTALIWLIIMIPAYLFTFVVSGIMAAVVCIFLFAEAMVSMCTCRMFIAIYNDIAPKVDIEAVKQAAQRYAAEAKEQSEDKDENGNGRR